MSRPFKLFRLQQIDSQLDWIHNRLAEIDRLLSEDAAVQSAAAHFELQAAAYQASRKALRHAEEEVGRQRIKIEQSEASLYGGKIRNPKELKDLENEVASLKRYLAVLEDRQLEAMLSEEEAADREKAAAVELDHARLHFNRSSQSLQEERDKIARDQSRLEGEHAATAASIEAADLALYEQIRAARRGVAVAKITDKACSACGSTLNAALLNAAHSPNALNRCETCGRILYTG